MSLSEVMSASGAMNLNGVMCMSQRHSPLRQEAKPPLLGRCAAKTRQKPRSEKPRAVQGRRAHARPSAGKPKAVRVSSSIPITGVLATGSPARRSRVLSTIFSNAFVRVALSHLVLVAYAYGAEYPRSDAADPLSASARTAVVNAEVIGAGDAHSAGAKPLCCQRIWVGSEQRQWLNSAASLARRP